MLKPATEIMDYVKTQVTKPQAEKLENSQKQILWFLFALFTAVLCWGLLKQTQSRKRKPKAALW